MVKAITKYKNFILQNCINLLLLLLCWGGFLRKSFNSDTVFHMVVNDADVMTRIEEGRYFVALSDFILLKAGLRTTTNLSITILLTFIILAMAMWEMQKIFSNWMPEAPWGKAGFICGLDLVFVNVLFAEVFMFGESSVYFAIAYWAAAAGVRCYAGKKYAGMLILYAIGVCSYQNAAVFAAIVIAFYIFLDEEMRLSFRAVRREAAGIVICMGMGLLNFLSVKVLERLGIGISFSKYPGTGDIGEKLADAVGHYIGLNKSGGGIFPNLWFPFIFALILWCVILYSCIRKRQLSQLLFLFIVWAGSNILLYVIPLVQEEFTLPPRLSLCFFLVQGLLLTVACKLSADNLKKLITFIGGSYLIVHLLFADFIVTNHFVSNTLDKVYVNMVYEEILKYERETGITVTKLAIIKDAYAPNNYEEVSYATDQINERVLGTATFSLIQIMTDRVFEEIEIPQPVYDKYFRDKDWNCFDLRQQLVFENDEAYWCVF